MIQTILLNNQNITVDLQQVLDFADVQKKGFIRSLPKTFYAPSNKLRNQIISLPETIKLLQQAKDKSCRDKAAALFKTAVLATIVAGAIIACAYDETAIGLGAGIPLYVICSLSMYYSSLSAANQIEERRPAGNRTVCCPDNEGDECLVGNLIAALLGGAILASIDEGFFKIPRLADVADEQRQWIQREVREYIEENIKLLPEACRSLKELDEAMVGCSPELFADGLMARSELIRRIEFYEKFKSIHNDLAPREQSSLEITEVKEEEEIAS